MKKTFLAFLLSVFALNCNAQIGEKIEKYIQLQKQEKLYIQTDRDCYLAGDTLWFRVHHIDAQSGLPFDNDSTKADCSQFVYIEMHNNNTKKLVGRYKIKRSEDGIFANNIALDGKLDAGRYTLVAYTRLMQNLKRDYFAYKEIDIVAMKPTTNITANATNNSEEGNTMPRITIAALPEGGQLIVGHIQRLAFKVVDEAGYGVDATVRLMCADTEEVLEETQTEHLGMGSIHFMPEEMKKYRLEAYDKNHRSCYVAVPQPLKQGVSMRVLQRSGELHIIPIAEGVEWTDLTLLIYSNGGVIAEQRLNGKPVSIDTTNMRKGVKNIAIVNHKQKRVCAERVVFI